MFAPGGNLGFAFEKLLVAPQRQKGAAFPPPPWPSTIQNFKNLDRPSTIQISKIWIESKNSRSNLKKIKLALNLLDPILRKKLDRNLLDPIFKK